MGRLAHTGLLTREVSIRSGKPKSALESFIYKPRLRPKVVRPKKKSVVASPLKLGVAAPASRIGCSAGVRLLRVVELCELCGSRHGAFVA